MMESHTWDSIIIHLVGFELELVCLCVTEQQAPASALPTQTAVGEMKVQNNIYLGGGSPRTYSTQGSVLIPIYR